MLVECPIIKKVTTGADDFYLKYEMNWKYLVKIMLKSEND